MNGSATQTPPVIFLIYNRPDTIRVVLQEIAQAKPSKLLIVADGPRVDRPEDVELSQAARAVVEDIDWECDVLRNYADINLGCGRRVSTGLEWAFEQVEEAIILEDDCLPHPTFFPFCTEMLYRYRHDDRVMHINGTNPIAPSLVSNTYRYSHLFYVWGWATWRRAWKLYDFEMRGWELLRNQNELRKHFPRSYRKVVPLFEGAYQGQLDTWDMQWGVACHLHQALSVLPEANLITNIGLVSGTHTVAGLASTLSFPRGCMQFPCDSPDLMHVNKRADDKSIMKTQGAIDRLRRNARLRRIPRKIGRILSSWARCR